MRDEELIQVAHMRHQASAALNLFGTDTDEDNVMDLDSEPMVEAFKQLQAIFDPRVIGSFVNEIGPKIMSTIVQHEGGLEDMMAVRKQYPRVDDIWITGIVNVGVHMFYLGMHTADIKSEEKQELANQFQAILSKFDGNKGNEDAREETEN